MKYLGIDYGTKRTGVAISDDEGRFAVLKETIPGDMHAVLYRLHEIVQTENIDELVIGLPVNQSGQSTDMTVHVQAFIAALRERIVLPVHTFDERLTSSLAAQLLGSNKHPKRDQVSAQIILQNYLDQRQHTL
jgi:putative Holliday junction resolvase